MSQPKPFNLEALFMRLGAAFVSLFFLAFTLATGIIFVRQVRHDVRVAQAYQETRCTIVERSEWPAGSPEPEDAVLVRYERGGAQQSAWADPGRYYFAVEYPPVPLEEQVDFTMYERMPCWVDPDAPEDVVFGHTPWTSYAFVLFPLACAAGLIFALRVVIYGPGKGAK